MSRLEVHVVHCLSQHSARLQSNTFPLFIHFSYSQEANYLNIEGELFLNHVQDKERHEERMYVFYKYSILTKKTKTS